MPADHDPFDVYPTLGTMRADLSEYDHTSTNEEPKDGLADEEEQRPIAPLMVLLGLIVLTLGIRLIDLQIFEGTRNRVLAEGNRIRSREIRPPRGEIRDRNGVVLATNVARYALEIYPAELPRKTIDREAIFSQLTVVTGQSIEVVRGELSQQGLTSLEPITLIDSVEREQALIWQVKLSDLPGVSITKIPRREYAPIPGLGHILGYVGRLSEEDHTRWSTVSLASYVGKTGLEYQYETVLQGKPGEERIEVDAKGRVERTLAELASTQGVTLVVTLDSHLQTSLASHVASAAQARGSAKAAAVVLDVATGGVLAMVSLPDYDPNVFVRDDLQDLRAQLLDDPNQPLLNRSVLGTYPSGSTIKPVIATAALAEQTISQKTMLDTSAGVIEIGQWRFPDWKVHGVADVRRALAESNDIFFYALGGGYQQIPGLGVDRMKTWLNRFGFGGKTGIDLPSEAKGLVPDNAWKQERFHESWYIGDSYHLAIGQGFFLATPLQLATAIAAIAGNGTLPTPHFFKKVEGDKTFTSDQREREVASPEILQIIREGMRLTVTDGTARTLQELAVPVAGKTGTAQFGSADTTHSWFVGFAPADQPQIAFAFLVEGGGESSDAAVPAAKAFLKDWIQLQSIP